MGNLKVIVSGGRDFSDVDFVFEYLDKFYEEKNGNIELILGGASGVDSFAEQWAKERGVLYDVFHANWRVYGKKAGPIRNEQMLNENPDLVIIFPGGKGTKNMKDIATRKNVPVLHASIDSFVDDFFRYLEG